MEASEERIPDEPVEMTARQHALEASRLASAIAPAQARMRAVMEDPHRSLEAVAVGAVKAHNESLDYTIKLAEMHARVADVLLRTEALDCLLRHTER